ncbi:MAG: heme biosynthesis HemY N-terminal domain-containing protein [Tahibacter sp.]
MLLVTAAVFGSLAWHWIAQDPGYVMIRVGTLRVETSLVFAVLALAFALAIFNVAWRLGRWPMRLWMRRARKKSRERMANGLIALAEGRYLRAEKELVRATQYRELRAPALLAAARAALAQGETERAQTALNEAAETAPAAALALRARLLREQGDFAESYRLLAAEARTGTLAPAALVETIEAALATEHADAAFSALGPLSRSQSLPASRYAALEARVLAAVLAAQPSADAANTFWAGLSRAQRRVPAALAAYARRVATLGQPLPGMSEVEAFLRKDWADEVVLAYADLGDEDAGARMRKAEQWLSAQPNNVALLTTLGRLCVDNQLWGKAHEYLERALAIREEPLTWETLGDCCAGEGEHVAAQIAYSNALALSRGGATRALPGRNARLGLNTTAIVVEERSEHGVPRLPGIAR